MMHKILQLVLFSYLTSVSIQVTVTVKSTKFMGSMNTVDGKQVNRFLGIPYAQPPVKNLRFKKPLPIEEPPKIVDATEWTPACYQNELFKEILINKTVSEDCLHLNVWSPKTDTERQYEEEALRPVLFWIHGGAYISDSASRQIYDAQWLAAKSDAVVVTINYRLDIFGFLYTGTDDAPGNVGLWDQALALEWVIDNIAYFGGDPKKITIVGENAGAFSVGVHLLSPISRNLFQNAVLISGSAINYIIGEKPEVAKKKWLLAANELACGDGKEFDDEAMECLRNREASELSKTLLKLSQTAKTKNKEFDEITPQMVFGDQFLPEEPLKMIADGNYKRSVSVLIGHTDDEGGYMLPMVDMEKYSVTNTKDITKGEAFDDLKKLTKQLITKTPIDGEAVAKTYFGGSQEPTGQYRRTIGVALGDFYITCPTILFAKLLIGSDNKNKVNVYHYYWTRKLSDRAVPCADWMGSCHGSDTYMLFGDPFVNKQLYTDDDRTVSLNFMKTFAHFANHSRPLDQWDKEWPKYYLKDEEIIAPYYEFSKKKSPTKKVYAKNLKTKHCEKLWKKYIL